MQVERKLYSIKPIFIKKKTVLNICIGRVWKLYDKFMVTSGNGTLYDRCHLYFIHFNNLWVFSHEPILHLHWEKQILAGRTTVCGGSGEPCDNSRARIATQAQCEWHPLGLRRECGDSDVLNAYNIPHKALIIILTPRWWRLMCN